LEQRIQPKDRANYLNAEKALENNLSKDPIALLEEYAAEGIANVPTAALCLETFRCTVESLPDAHRPKVIQTARAGQRTLAWLRSSGHDDTDDFVDNPRLANALVPFLLEECGEDFIWEWIKGDLALGSQNPSSPAFSLPADQIYDAEYFNVKRKLHKYRWKAYVVCALVEVRMKENENQAADAALNVILKSDTLESDQIFFHHREAQPLLRLFRSTMHHSWKNTDSVLYDRFSAAVARSEPNALFRDWNIAILILYHPQRPSALPVLPVFRRVFSADPRGHGKILLNRFTDPRYGRTQGFLYRLMIRSVALLRLEGHKKDANWVLHQTHRFFPGHADFYEKDIRREVNIVKGLLGPDSGSQGNNV
jgi:hypothetical protein